MPCTTPGSSWEDGGHQFYPPAVSKSVSSEGKHYLLNCRERILFCEVLLEIAASASSPSPASQLNFSFLDYKIQSQRKMKFTSSTIIQEWGQHIAVWFSCHTNLHDHIQVITYVEYVLRVHLWVW